MAYSFSRLSTGGHQHYNIDYAVGTPGSNWKPDVMLLQAMLNLLYFDNGGEFFLLDYSVHNFQAPPGADALAIDGLKGPLTQQLIDSYQHRLQQIGAYPADGHLDPLQWTPGPKPTKPTRGKGFLHLSNSLLISDEVNGTRRHRAIATDPSYPSELRGALSVRKITARQYTAVRPVAPREVFTP